MERRGTVYGVFDDSGRCRYVGATIRKIQYREREHLAFSEKGETPLARAIRKWGGVKLTPLIRDIPEGEVGLYEKSLIGLFRSVGQADLNLLSGGYRSEDYLNFRKTEDQRERQSEISRANWADPDWAERQRTKIATALRSPDYREAARRRAIARVAEGTFGTSRKGSQSGHVKLREEDVLSIREEYSSGGTTFKALGERYGVTESCIYRIVRRRSWTHV